MLSETICRQLAEYTYRADAKRQVCILPLSGIYWDDELPDIRELMKIPEDDRDEMFRLFGLRSKLWKGVALQPDEQQFWDTARSEMPRWAFFNRLAISADDQRAQSQVEQETEKAIAELFAQADQVSVREKNGIQRFSATIRLNKEEGARGKKPWWKRIFRGNQAPRS